MNDVLLLLKSIFVFWKKDRYVSKLAPAALRKNPNFFLKACQLFGVESLRVPYANRYLIDIDPFGGSISEGVLLNGEYQSSIMRSLPDSLVFDCPLFVNVGANIGTTCMNAAIRGFGKIIAFEPTKRNFDILSRNISLNSIDAQIYQFGLGSRNHTCSINLHPTSGGRHSIKKQFDGGVIENIEIRTLESVGISLGYFLWIDAEGYELEVVKGGLASIAENCIGTCIEVSPVISGIDDALELISILRGVFNVFLNASGQELSLDELSMTIREGKIKQIDLVCLK